MDTFLVTSASMEIQNGKEIYRDDAGSVATPLAGAIFSVEVGAPGLPEPAFRA
jgi:hypothetical protein